MLYANSIRAQLRKDNPDLAMSELVRYGYVFCNRYHPRISSPHISFQTKEIGNRYKSISVEEKAKWQAKADAAKEVYKSDLAKYQKAKATADKKPTAKTEIKKKPEPESDSSEASDASSEDDSDESDSDSD